LMIKPSADWYPVLKANEETDKAVIEPSRAIL